MTDNTQLNHYLDGLIDETSEQSLDYYLSESVLSTYVGRTCRLAHAISIVSQGGMM